MPPNGNRPNIVIYISHDTGQHIGPYGIPTVHTPNADRLAGQGAVFENFFSTAPQCSPSRASLYTGRYPHCNGVMGLSHADFAWDFAAGEVHAAQRLGELGYATAAIGITHETHTPEKRGFDFIDKRQDAWEVGAAFDQWLGAREDSSCPFYAQIGTFQTHRPFHDEIDESSDITVPGYLEATEGTRMEFARLGAGIRQWDAGLGDVMNVLDERGLADDTILIVTTDHGIAMPRAKCTLYDPGLGVMLLMRWPGCISAGSRYDQLLSNVDVLPTLLEAIGAGSDESIQGKSFYKLLTGGDYSPRDKIFAEMTFHQYYDPMRCVRTGRYKYIRNFEMCPGVHIPSDVAESRTFAENAKRVLHPEHHVYEELYDISADALEMNNIAGEPGAEDVRRELSGDLEEWMKRTDDPILSGPVSSPFYAKSVGLLGG